MSKTPTPATPRELRITIEFDQRTLSNEPEAIGSALADAVLGTIKRLYLGRPDQHSQCTGSVLSALAGGILGVYGEEPVIQFCLDTITACRRLQAQESGDQAAAEFSGTIALGDSLALALIRSIDDTYAPDSEESRFCLNYVLGGLAGMLGVRYGDEAVRQHCSQIAQLATEELAAGAIVQ